MKRLFDLVPSWIVSPVLFVPTVLVAIEGHVTSKGYAQLEYLMLESSQ